MKKKKRKQRKSSARSVGQTALKLARAHTKDLGTTDPEQRRPVEKSVQLLAAYLPAQGGTIYWESFDVRGFFEQLSSWSRGDQERIALHLMGFYYWLCVQQLASAPSVAEILGELIDLFPESGTLSMLYQLSMIGLAGGIDAVLASYRSAGDPLAMN